MFEEGFMKIRVSGVLYLLSLLALSPGAEGLSRGLLDRVSDRDLLSVDRQGHLWAWSRSSSRVEIFTKDDEPLAVIRVPQARSLDVDAEWGIAALVGEGTELRGLALDGRPLFVLPLEKPMGDVVWIDVRTVAVSPTLAGHRVEIWDVEVGALARAVGQEAPIQSSPGAQFSRSVDLAYDSNRRHLFTVESRTGDLRVFNLQGELLGRTQLENPRLEEFDRWLGDIDRDMRKRGKSHLQGLWYFRLSLDRTGQAWVVQRCGEQGQTVLVRVSPSAAKTTKKTEAACCSTRSLISESRLILHRPPDLPGGPCIHSMNVPEQEETNEVPNS